MSEPTSINKKDKSKELYAFIGLVAKVPVSDLDDTLELIDETLNSDQVVYKTTSMRYLRISEAVKTEGN